MDPNYNSDVAAPKPNVFAYLDFREYLADFQKYKQDQDPGFTQAHICRMLGVPKTRGFFASILRGRGRNGRELTRTFLNRFLNDVLELNRGEEEYFRVLVDFNQSDNAREKEILYHKLLDLNQVPTSRINSLHYYQDWSHAVVRALLDVQDCPEGSLPAPSDLVVAMPPRKMRASMKLLADLGLIEVRQGFWKPTMKALVLDPEVKREAVARYQLACLELGKQALLGKSDLWKRLHVNTVSLSAKASANLFEAYEKFKEKVRAIVTRDTDPAEDVYQINLQIAPLTRGRKGK